MRKRSNTTGAQSGTPTGVPPGEVTVRATLLRTLTLVLLTLAFAFCIRALPPLMHGVQYLAGTSAWQTLYDWFGIQSSLGREQMILIGIMMVCFCLALVVQGVGLVLWARLRR
ncbi:hypothetical protein [Swaminathania salitolerans]|uniref:Uncharacterized protein n=1 Tax=Swaminathania salitolerans TaxID=182838 RepID=A0A511BPV1_9PROT|nr:hypothetical protein [Swaminathania salitolerans]GEL02285.1 hypothetical protein SSA02_14480 [Swaminathania salitolerans]